VKGIHKRGATAKVDFNHGASFSVCLSYWDRCLRCHAQ